MQSSWKTEYSEILPVVKKKTQEGCDLLAQVFTNGDNWLDVVAFKFFTTLKKNIEDHLESSVKMA